MTRAYLFLLLFILSAACSPSVEKPEQLIPEDTYVKLLVEFQLARSYSGLSDSLSADSLEERILNKYQITRPVFKVSHRYYEQFPEEQKERINRAIELLKMDRVERDTLQTSPAVD